MELNTQDTIQWLFNVKEKIQTNEAYLTSLDQPIGDGDHGINMVRGFQEVANKMGDYDYETVADVLKDTAMTLISKVGGASGPLFGTAFLKMSQKLPDADSVDQAALTQALDEATQGVMERGKAEEGEKTMIDVWMPVVNFLKGDKDDFQPDELAQVAKDAMEETKNIQATKGRASYFKEKSVGHIDPGAASSYFIFEALADVLRE